MSENQFTCRRCGSPVSIDDFDWRDFNLFYIQKKRRLCHDCIEEGQTLCLCGHEANHHRNHSGSCKICGCYQFRKIVESTLEVS